MSKSKDREDYEPKFHFLIIDEDIDRIEKSVEKMASDVNDIKKLGLGILVALTTSSIVLVATRIAG